MAAADHGEGWREPLCYMCPRCGAEVSVGSERCLSCEPRRSWEQQEGIDGLDLPGPADEWDYEDFVAREFGAGGRPPGAPRVRRLWVVVALGLVLVMFGFALGCG